MAQVVTERTRWERGTACTARVHVQGMAKAAVVRPLRVSVRQVDEEGRPCESTSVGDIALTARPSCGLAAWGAGTSVSGLVSDLTWARDMHMERQLSAPPVRAEEMPDAGLTLTSRTVLPGIGEMPCE